MSGERGSSSGVSGDCDVLSWLPRLFSRKSSLGAESWSCCNTSQSACDELCGQGSAGMSMSQWRSYGWARVGQGPPTFSRGPPNEKLVLFQMTDRLFINDNNNKR